MKRRQFITPVGGVSLAWPLGTHAQQPAMPVVGLLHQGSQVAAVQWLAAFRQGLSSYGYVEGRNVRIECRWVEDQYDRLPELAADLVGQHVAVIAVAFLPAALATKAATATIPIVFLTGCDPVAAGLVPSLNRPNSNVTGLTMMDAMLGAKNLELLHELVPKATVIAVLMNRNNVNAEPQLRDLQTAFRTRGVQLVILTASHESEIDVAFATLAQQQIGAMLVGYIPSTCPWPRCHNLRGCYR
jgi:putative tryptophan/tyrosine transport system substrate-binding protein